MKQIIAKKHIVSEDINELKKAIEDLTAVSNEIFSKLYQNAQSQTSENAQANAEQSNDKKDDKKDGDPEIVVE